MEVDVERYCSVTRQLHGWTVGLLLRLGPESGRMSNGRRFLSSTVSSSTGSSSVHMRHHQSMSAAVQKNETRHPAALSRHRSSGRAISPLESALKDWGITPEDLEPGTEARRLLELRQDLVSKALKEEAEANVDEMVCRITAWPDVFVEYSHHCAMVDCSPDC